MVGRLVSVLDCFFAGAMLVSRIVIKSNFWVSLQRARYWPSPFDLALSICVVLKAWSKAIRQSISESGNQSFMRRTRHVKPGKGRGDSICFFPAGSSEIKVHSPHQSAQPTREKCLWLSWHHFAAQIESWRDQVLRDQSKHAHVCW